MAKTNYPVGDFFIRIKNIVMAGKKEVLVEKTKLIKSVSKLLQEGGYFESVTEDEGVIRAKLAFRHKKAVISDIKLISTPGLRVYMRNHEIKAYKKPYRLVISTPDGLMFSDTAVKKNLGGEVIAGIL
jgi:small subunit ribosomal protein S8